MIPTSMIVGAWITAGLMVWAYIFAIVYNRRVRDEVRDHKRNG